MKKTRFQLGYFIREGFHSIFSHGLMSFAAVCMIVACLIIMGSFSLVAVNADKMLGTLEAENEFLAYIDESYTDAQIEELKSRVERIPNVESARPVSKEEAKAAYLEGQETNGLYANLPDEVFRDRLVIKVKDLEEAQTRQDLVVKEYCQHGDRLAYLVCSKSNEEIRINLAGEVLINFLEEDE